MAVKVVTCDVCSTNYGVKYKCPSCKAAYCSVNCCKEHKLNNCPNSKGAHNEPANGDDASTMNHAPSSSRLRYSFETDDMVPTEKLELLRGSKKLKEMLENPHLRRMMEAIDRSSDTAQLIGDAMKEPIFTEMADECLKIIGGNVNVESEDEFT